MEDDTIAGDAQRGHDDVTDYLLDLKPDIFCLETIAPAASDTGASRPFKKWVDSFRSRKRVRPVPSMWVDGWPDEAPDTAASSPPSEHQWDQSSAGSSSILGTMKTTSLSMVTSSVTRSRANTISSHQSVSFGSAKPNSDLRKSIDSVGVSRSLSLENATRTRAIRRRHLLHEIYASESNYVHGLQTLIKLLSTYLTTRPAILRDLEAIYSMHESFQRRLHIVSPLSTEPPIMNLPPVEMPRLRMKFQTCQGPSLRTRNLKALIDSRLRRTAADPSEALRVAKEIENLSDGFGAYEGFCSRYHLLEGDLGLLRKALPADGFWAEGIEALARSVDSAQNKKHDSKKSMTVDDLIMKPVQRVCKYPLLLAEMLKNVPAGDCPSTHNELMQILDKTRQMVSRVDTATGNPALKNRIHRTMSLQERLDYNGQTTLYDVYQQLGPLSVCGVLHVAYKTPDRITGEYLVCILFPGYMVLARAGSEHRRLVVVASLYVLDMTVDAVSNGQGLTCYDVPYSWKVIFQDGDHRYELILSASSASEERCWKTELLKTSAMSPAELPTISLEPRELAFCFLPVVPLDAIDNRAGILARRTSVRSLSANNPKRQPEQVVIKRTHNPLHDDEVRSRQEAGIVRTRSAVREHAPVILSPLRQDRVRLERSIADIFSREILPFPGMVMGRGDYLRSQSLMRGVPFRTPFSSRRSVSISKITVSSSDEGCDGQDGGQATEDTTSPRSHENGSPIQPVFSRRHRHARAASDCSKHSAATCESKAKSKPSKRWLSALSILGLFGLSRDHAEQE